MSDTEKTEAKEEAKKPEPTRPEIEREEQAFEIEPGEYVRLTAEAFIDPDAQDMTPLRFFKLVGWPNKFMVVDIFIDTKHGRVLRLDPCCGWARDPENRAKIACQAHPAKFFEKCPPEPDRHDKNDRYMEVNLAGYDLLSVEFLNGGKEPSLLVKFAGQKPFRISGAAARELARFLQDCSVF